MSEETLTEQEKQEEKRRRDALSAVIRRLEAGERQFVLGFQWSRGDSIAAEPTKLSKSLILLFHAYIEIYGATDHGQTNLADKDTYEKVVDLLIDTSNFLEAKEKLDKRPHEWEAKYEIIPTLKYLEKKYSEKTGVKINENLGLLESLICQEAYKIVPKLIAHITTVASLETRGGFPMFISGEKLPRFRRPDLDGARREKR